MVESWLLWISFQCSLKRWVATLRGRLILCPHLIHVLCLLCEYGSLETLKSSTKTISFGISAECSSFYNQPMFLHVEHCREAGFGQFCLIALSWPEHCQREAPDPSLANNWIWVSESDTQSILVYLSFLLLPPTSSQYSHIWIRSHNAVCGCLLTQFQRVIDSYSIRNEYTDANTQS